MKRDGKAPVTSTWSDGYNRECPINWIMLGLLAMWIIIPTLICCCLCNVACLICCCCFNQRKDEPDTLDLDATENANTPNLTEGAAEGDADGAEQGLVEMS